MPLLTALSLVRGRAARHFSAAAPRHAFSALEELVVRARGSDDVESEDEDPPITATLFYRRRPACQRERQSGDQRVRAASVCMSGFVVSVVRACCCVIHASLRHAVRGVTVRREWQCYYTCSLFTRGKGEGRLYRLAAAVGVQPTGREGGASKKLLQDKVCPKQLIHALLEVGRGDSVGGKKNQVLPR